MRLLAVLLLLGSVVRSIRAVIFNFVKTRYVTFLRTDAALDDNFYTPLAILVFFSAATAAQYGFLPLEADHVVKRLRWLRRKLRYRRDAVPYRYRRDVTDDALDWPLLLQVAQFLEEGASKFQGLEEGKTTS